MQAMQVAGGLPSKGRVSMPCCPALACSSPWMGVKRSLQSAGLSLGVLANVLVVLAASTDFWSRFSDGHNGLWRLCRKNNCTNSPCETMLAVTAACLVLAAGAGLLASVLGVRVLHASRDGTLIPPRGRNACLVFFLSALLLLAGMVGYTARDAWQVDSFFSWSYFTAWLALPFSILAGFCFLFADMILQSTDAISGFPVCL